MGKVTCSVSSLLLALFATRSFAQTSATSEGAITDCGCYTITNTTTSSLFTNHVFFDFRNLDNGSSVDFTIPPPAVTNSEDSGSEPATDPYFTSSAFTSQWSIQNWKGEASSTSPVLNVNSPRNVYILRDSKTSPTHLTLRSTRLTDFQSIAEIDSVPGDYMHASIRVKARIVGSPGAVAGIFTYADDDNESDIEILTNDLDSGFHATNQPGNINGVPVPDATSFNAITDPTSPEKNTSWTGWTVYRLDWTPTKSEWFTNGYSVSNKTYSVPRKPSYFILNVWSDGGSWSGEMAVGGVATMDIEWLEMAYNTTTSSSCADEPVCVVACDLTVNAGVGTLGVPQPASSTSPAPSASAPSAPAPSVPTTTTTLAASTPTGGTMTHITSTTTTTPTTTPEVESTFPLSTTISTSTVSLAKTRTSTISTSESKPLPFPSLTTTPARGPTTAAAPSMTTSRPYKSTSQHSVTKTTTLTHTTSTSKATSWRGTVKRVTRMQLSTIEVVWALTGLAVVADMAVRNLWQIW
ncbi:MAG: hypothetical protein MMC33_004884 [Icmadophila ericetorum]|nr:hypothetical protein [Icmadophila ericetorum]